MSSELVMRLKHRARSFLREAMEAEDSDLAAFFAEQVMQLYTKVALYELVRRRIPGLASAGSWDYWLKGSERPEYTNLASKVASFVGESRALLIKAEEAYILSRYGVVEYTRDEAGTLIRFAEKLIEFLEGAEESVKLG